LNNVQILGTITRDIELKYTQSSTAIASFGIAYNDRWKDQQGQQQDKAHFFDVTAFGKTAENLNQYFRKGSRILISGSLNFESWQDQQGNNRSKVTIKLERFDFIDKKDDNQGQQQNQNNQQQQYNQPPMQQNQNNGGQQQYNQQQQNQQQQHNNQNNSNRYNQNTHQ